MTEGKKTDECCCQLNCKMGSDGATVQSASACTSHASVHMATDGNATPGGAGNPFVIDDIEDLDSDFKTDSKKFRTPRQAAKPQQQQQQQISDLSGDEAALEEEVRKASSSDDHSPPECCCSCQNSEQKKPGRAPRIYFGTRTHKQIAQIARELGKTGYRRSRMTILASRQHTCIDPEVSSMPNKNEECRSKLDNVGCRYKDRVPSISHARLEDYGLGFAWDLEDFVGFCKTCKACPYFGTRLLRETADIILCPYNYLIDPKIRRSMEISLKGEVVILDEGHNIEDAAREAASLTLTLKQITDAMNDLQTLIRKNVKPVEHTALENLVSGLYDLIHQHADTMSNGGGGQHENFAETNKIWSGMDMVAQLKLARAGTEQLEQIVKCVAALSESDKEEDAGSRWKKKNRPQVPDADKASAATMSLIEGMLIILSYMYKEKMKYMPDYRLTLTRTMTYSYSNHTNHSWLSKNRRGKKVPDFQYSLNFWCLNPAVAFSDLQDVRSVILTSGTLSPMTTFQSELSTPFPIQLEASHVIGRSQVWVGAVSRGPNGGQLLGSYQTSETFTYQDEVGHLVQQVCETMPNGILCFLSSYKAMTKLRSRWESTGTWEKIQQRKAIMCEPRASESVDFDELMKTFYRIIQKTEDPGGAEGGVYEGEEHLGGKTGALFLAVTRGKVSEGMDFADNNARAVITVGIPFPNVKDVQVELKKQYNNEHSAKRGLLSGRDWYEIQAYRALNQALGRCIRHRHDWGALILVDERFGKNPGKYVKGLSKWLRNKVEFYQYFQQARNSLQKFTKERRECATTLDVSVMMSQTPSHTPTRLPRSSQLIPDVEPPSRAGCAFLAPVPSAMATPGGAIANGSLSVPRLGVEPGNCQALSAGEAIARPKMVSGCTSASTLRISETAEGNAVPERYMKMSQAGGFLPVQISGTPLAEAKVDGSDPAPAVPQTWREQGQVTTTQRLVSSQEGALEDLPARTFYADPPPTQTQQEPFQPPLASQQFLPCFTSTQRPSQFCTQVTSPLAEPQLTFKADGKQHSSSNKAEQSKQDGNCTIVTLQENLPTNTPELGRRKNPTDLKPKSLFQFVDLSAMPDLKTPRADSPDLFDDEDECFSHSPPMDLEPTKINAVLETLKADPKEYEAVGDTGNLKSKLEPRENGGNAVTVHHQSGCDRKRNKLKRHSLSSVKIEVDVTAEQRTTFPAMAVVPGTDENTAKEMGSGEGECLNTRRSKRRRRGTFCTLPKRQKSVKNLQHVLACSHCKETLARVEELHQPDAPHFLKDLKLGATSAYVCDIGNAHMEKLSIIQAQTAPGWHGPPMDSYHSVRDKCFVQWLQCATCTTDKDKKLPDFVPIAAHVMHVADTSETVQAGQVWLLASKVEQQQ